MSITGRDPQTVAEVARRRLDEAKRVDPDGDTIEIPRYLLEDLIRAARYA